MRRLRFAGVVLTLALPAVVGCSGGSGGPRALPPATRTSPPTASPSPSLSPGVAGEVEAAVHRYFDAVNAALRSGDVTGVRRMAIPGCTCNRLADSVASTLKKGKAVGAHFDVSSVRVHDVVARTAAAEVAYAVPAYQVVNANGRVVDSFATHADRLDMSWVSDGSSWFLSQSVRLGA